MMYKEHEQEIDKILKNTIQDYDKKSEEEKRFLRSMYINKIDISQNIIIE